MEKQIIVEKITDVEMIRKIVKWCWGINSTATLSKWYGSKHSPMYTQQFLILVCAEKSVMDQMRTHEKNGCQFFCDSGRPDTGNNTDGNSRNALRKFAIWCNAEHIMKMAEKRLCYKAELPTWEFMMKLRQVISDGVDRSLADKMQPKCTVYRDGCKEFEPCNMIHRDLPYGVLIPVIRKP